MEVLRYFNSYQSIWFNHRKVRLRVRLSSSICVVTLKLHLDVREIPKNLTIFTDSSFQTLLIRKSRYTYIVYYINMDNYISIVVLVVSIVILIILY